MVAGFRIRSRGYLPHWEAENEIYFVTFRLHDSLPASLFEPPTFESNRLALRDSADTPSKLPKSSKLARHLDAGHGACYLKDPRVAAIVARALRQFDGDRYDLLAWCIMPNHVHVVIHLLDGRDLSRVLHSWKSYSSSRANQVLGRGGTFWQREYYDHLVRNADELQRIIRYVAENPIKAGLKDWTWWEIRSN